MTEPDEQTAQDANEAFYDSLYGPPKLPELTPENEDLYNAFFPTKGQS